MNKNKIGFSPGTVTAFPSWSSKETGLSTFTPHAARKIIIAAAIRRDFFHIIFSFLLAIKIVRNCLNAFPHYSGTVANSFYDRFFFAYKISSFTQFLEKISLYKLLRVILLPSRSFVSRIFLLIYPLGLYPIFCK